jgi:predicted CopG family antitoxin
MTKVISLSNKAYNILAKQKKYNESFSDLILNLATKSEKKLISSFAGKWESDDIDEIFEQIKKDRHQSVSREAAF